MRFVDDDRVVGAQQRVGARLRKEDAVGHELDACRVRKLPAETMLETDDVAERRLEFVGDAFGDGDGGEAARLGAGDAPAVVSSCPNPCRRRR